MNENEYMELVDKYRKERQELDRQSIRLGGDKSLSAKIIRYNLKKRVSAISKEVSKLRID